MAERDSTGAVGTAADRYLHSPIAQKARADLKEAVYKMWLDCATSEEREKVWAIATGAEMFWGILGRYSDAKSIAELAEELKDDVA